jgi:hypothetical protein
MTLMEIGVIRRDIGQLILATAILDDTIAWIIIAVIAGIATHGTVDLQTVGASIAGTALFLAFCLTIGRRLVAWLIVWVNDHMTIEVPVITAILVVMLTLALTTELIGVHTALGAFVAGIMIGQSPILTEHIEAELRGFIFAFFSPVFFAVAGLGMDLRTLMDPTLLLFTVAVIGGGEHRQVRRGADRRPAGRPHPARIAGARDRPQRARLDRGDHRQHRPRHGCAEQGALHHDRRHGGGHHHGDAADAALGDGARAARRGRGQRLDKEEAEHTQSLPKMERALVYVDHSPNGRLAARLAGLFAARQHVLTTVLEVPGEKNPESKGSGEHLAEAAHAATEHPDGAQSLLLARPDSHEGALQREIAHGYDIVFVGLERPIDPVSRQLRRAASGAGERFRGPGGDRRPTAPARPDRSTCRSTSCCRPAARPTRGSPPRSPWRWPTPARGRSPRCTSSSRRRTPRCCAAAPAAPASRCWSTPIAWASAAACRSRD